MALNPNIALGVRGVEVANPLAQYAQISQLQSAQNQNALAQYQLATAQREQESTNALNEAYRSAYNPQTGDIDINTLRKTLSTGGFGSKLLGLEKTLGELQAQKLTQQKLQGEITAQPIALQIQQANLVDTKLKQSRAFLDTINPSDPNAPQQYFSWFQANHADPILGPTLKARGITEEQFVTKIQQAMNQGPQAFAELLNQSKLGTEKFMELNKPVTFSQDFGTGGRVMSRAGLGGPATVVPGSEFTKGKTFADITSERQANLAASRFAFDQAKFAYEKANPGFELKEAEDGSIVGVNKRTLEAFPVTVGGAAPAVAPAMPGGGVPGARLPAPGAGPAAPGMAPPAAGAPGVPLRGKGTALTESQGNATAYGMRMKEANAILEPLENAGKTNTGLIKGAVSGAVGLVPFIGDKLEDVSGSVFNALPRVLGGLSPEQQQVAQARINFITAILRKESGAAIGASEFATAEKNYFPKPGDDAATIAQKQAARKTAIKAMEIQAGPGAKQMGGANVLPGATPTNPLGLPGL